MKIAVIGGHLAPALAVIDALPSDASVVFIGRKYTMEGDQVVSLEYKTITERNIPFIPLTTGRLQRKLSRHTLHSLIKIPQGFFQALRILNRERPDVVIGFGGYVSVPVIVAAHTLKIPVVIHEQTLGAGLANKTVARFATKVCVSWPQTVKLFPAHKTVVTGNPMRKFHAQTPTIAIPKGRLPLLYVTGGSAGAHALNLLVEGVLEKLLHHAQIIHQTGDAKEFSDFVRLDELKATLPHAVQSRYVVTKFVPPAEVGGIMQAADLVISRSGMNTVTELLTFGKPCLLIPLPYGQKNEQLTNAQFLKKTGIGDYVHQHELTPDTFFRKVVHMLEDLAKYKTHAHQAKDLVQKDAAEHIIKVVYEVAKQNP